MGTRNREIIYSKYVVDMTPGSDMKVVAIDDQFTAFLGYTKEDIKAGNVTLPSLILEQDREDYFAKMQELVPKYGEAYLGHYMKKKNGEACYVFCFGKDRAEDDHVYADIMFAELDSFVAQEKELAENRVLLRDVMDSLVGGIGVFKVDVMQLHAEYLSDGFYEVLGMERDQNEVDAGSFTRFLYGEDILKFFEDVRNCIETGKSTIAEYRFIKLEGGFRWMQVRFSLLDKDNGLPRISAFFLDITDSKQEQMKLRAKNEELSFKSEIDSLTGVYNHNAYIQHVNQSLERAEEGSVSALLMIDVDDFKLVNDILGHYEGDRVLKETAKKLNDLSLNKGFAGRIGGDEFSVFLNDISNRTDAVLFAGEVCRELAKIQVKTGYSVSVGLSINDAPMRSFQDFYTEADQALYVAKRGGKNQYVIYDPEQMVMDSAAKKRSDTYFTESGMLLDDMKDAVYITDVETNELLFMNATLKETLGYEADDMSWQGQKCYEIANGCSGVCAFCPMSRMPENAPYIWSHEDAKNGRKYVVRSEFVRWDNKKAYMQTAIDVTTTEEVETAIRSRVEIEDTLRECILSVSADDSFQNNYQRALNILGSHYGAERTILNVEVAEGRNHFFEWHAERKKGILTEDGQLQADFDLPVWHDPAYIGKDIVISNIESVRELNEDLYNVMSQNQIWSFYSFPLKHTSVHGNIMILNPKQNLGDLSVFRLVTVILGNEVEKRNLFMKQEYEMNHDTLTGVLNRACYINDIAKLQEPESVGFLVADVDNLKEVNQTYGFEYGNQMVKQIADIMAEAFEGYRLYRFDGDDFAILCENISKSDFIDRVENLKAKLALHQVGASVGYVWDDFEKDIRKMNIHAEQLLKSDKMKRREKQGAKGNVEKNRYVTNVDQFIENGNFVLYLQPKMDIEHNCVCGAEALIRLNHPTNGLMMPARFIPQMENMGVISMVDLWVFEHVCEMLHRWKEEGRRLFPISFNFSRLTLLEEDLVEKVEAIIERYDVDKEYIEIEITETMGDIEQDMITEIADRLHKKSFQLSMDDFGTKYSSISILSLMRFDELKIDRSMVNNLVENDISRKVLKHVISMCDDIGVKCIAEGVETEEQRDILKSMECLKVQGYLYSKPVAVDVCEKLYNPL